MLFITGLFIYHMYLVFSNQTTKEELKKNFNPITKNPYNRGCCTNTYRTVICQKELSKSTLEQMIDESMRVSKDTVKYASSKSDENLLPTQKKYNETNNEEKNVDKYLDKENVREISFKKENAKDSSYKNESDSPKCSNENRDDVASQNGKYCTGSKSDKELVNEDIKVEVDE